MSERINLQTLDPAAYQALLALESYIAKSGLDAKLLELIKIRASQINGCAFCINMHTQDARKKGETEQRIYLLNAWQDTDLFSEKEKAALAMTEAVTLISDQHVPDEIYEELKTHFDVQQIAHILMAIIAINSWNRVAISTKMTV